MTAARDEYLIPYEEVRSTAHLNIHEAADVLGVDCRTAQRWRHRAGLVEPRGGSVPTPLRERGYRSRAEAIAAVSALEHDDAAEALGVSVTTVRRWRAQYAEGPVSPVGEAAAERAIRAANRAAQELGFSDVVEFVRAHPRLGLGRIGMVLGIEPRIARRIRHEAGIEFDEPQRGRPRKRG